jgi:hypothetical protein
MHIAGRLSLERIFHCIFAQILRVFRQFIIYFANIGKEHGLDP